jgi:hypothetical protein
MMNMGKRIEVRLNSLNWKRKDLLQRVPDLTDQALSNLIRRDSKRSEWDELIAEGLGVSVLWLVYGRNANHGFAEPLPAAYLVKTDDGESLLLSAYRGCDADGKAAMQLIAKALSKG